VLASEYEESYTCCVFDVVSTVSLHPIEPHVVVAVAVVAQELTLRSWQLAQPAISLEQGVQEPAVVPPQSAAYWPVPHTPEQDAHCAPAVLLPVTCRPAAQAHLGVGFYPAPVVYPTAMAKPCAVQKASQSAVLVAPAPWHTQAQQVSQPLVHVAARYPLFFR
jgi:hypothetical protein